MAYALAFRPEVSPARKRKDPPALFVIENDAFLGVAEDETAVAELPDTRECELSSDAVEHGSLAAKPQMSTSKWYRKLAISCGFHAAFALLLIGFVADEVLIAGSEDTMAALLGDGSVDANASGAPEPANPEAMNVSLVTMAMPKPVKEVETARPVEVAEPVERVTPVESIPVAVDPAPAEVLKVAPSEAPEILAVTPLQPTQDENVVQQPSREMIQPVEDEPVVKAVEKPVVQKPAIETHAPEKRTVEKPQEPAKKAAPAAKATKAPAKAASGGDGKNERTARSGIADGKNDGQKNADGNAKGKALAQGNAAVSNYPGTVTSKLRRALRRQGRLRGEVLVSFVVASNGSVTGVGIGRSSGNAAVDKAGMDTVRRAAPFPPIPADAGRSTWAFNIPLAFGG
ncbi:energy transducer TonB family protein [Phyllobacterium zundukense]|uniref:TonB C-terminal domain-containing protein n=1 Tax=Phyllobacterium zundukense TaxID=1867719 RepID=A0A2N9VXQ1_9HYPH|nr:energy transducer TonB [Phyllobacterium zundukense]ATU95730.1 hypothetical protein BLM14_28900 [Phyllobacterium zundukense]PIO44269.1 hypothetical protein B5P45_13425 [Phyllobacterium zundukense]